MLIKSLRWVDIVEDSVQEIKEQRKMNFDSMINKASYNIFWEIAEMKAMESKQMHNFPESESTIMSGLSKKPKRQGSMEGAGARDGPELVEAGDNTARGTPGQYGNGLCLLKWRSLRRRGNLYRQSNKNPLL